MSASVTQSAASTRAQSQSASSPSLVLQRKCACGSSSALTGECDECQSQRLLGKPLQAKLRVGAANDEYEREADRVADHVVRMSDATAASHTRMPPATGLVQRHVRGEGGAGQTSVPAIVHEVLSSAGQPLDTSTRAFFEPRFGYDFSRVRIHSDEKARQSARAVNAHAYTVGNQIVTSGARSLSRHLLAHELTHVVQQGGAEHSSAAMQTPIAQRLQRQPAPDTAEARPSAERSTSTQTFARLERDYPVFADRLTRMSQRIADLVETMQGPLILSGIRDSQSHLQAREEFDYYVDHLRRQERHMTQGDRYSPRDVHNWLVYVDGALGAVGPLMDLAERGVAEDVTEMTAIRQVRRQLATISAEVRSLQNVSFIRAEREEIESAAEASRAAAAARAEAAETPAGRQEAAVAYITKYVDDHWRADLDQASAGIHAITIGRYLVHDEGFDGPTIQAVLDGLRVSSIEVYDRAQFGGRLLVYLLEEGVIGLNVGSLLSATEETEEFHISGAGFYAGFEITWLDLLQREPLTAPNPSVSGPRDFVSLQLGFDKGILWGFGGALNDAFWDVVSTLNPMTYVQLHKLLTEQISDELWRFQTGQGLAGSLHKYIQDFADDSAFEIGEHFGRGVGFVLAQIFLTWVGAKVATLATSMLRATTWGKPVVEFAEKVADAMPWKEPKIVEGDTSPPNLGARADNEMSATGAQSQPSVEHKMAEPGSELLPQSQAVPASDLNRRAVAEVPSAEAGHEWMMHENGLFYRCSDPVCTSLRLQHEAFLAQPDNAHLLSELEALELRSAKNRANPVVEKRIADGAVILREISELEGRILAARAAHPVPAANLPFPSALDLLREIRGARRASSAKPSRLPDARQEATTRTFAMERPEMQGGGANPPLAMTPSPSPGELPARPFKEISQADLELEEFLLDTAHLDEQLRARTNTGSSDAPTTQALEAVGSSVSAPAPASATQELPALVVVRRRGGRAQAPDYSSEPKTVSADKSTELGSTSEEIMSTFDEETSGNRDIEQAEYEQAADVVHEPDESGHLNVHPTISTTTTAPERARAAEERSALQPLTEPEEGIEFGSHRSEDYDIPTTTAFRGPEIRPDDVRAREYYLGATPDKASVVGQAVIFRMRAEGLIRGNGPWLAGNPNNLEVLATDGNWYPIDDRIHMAHIIDAVTWWNEAGRFTGRRSEVVREFMTDPDNYRLDLGTLNCAAGAGLCEVYLPEEDI